MLIVSGSMGVGLVWGWLIGRRGGRMRQPLRTFAAMATATLLVAFEVMVLAGWLGLLLFLGATALALLLHIGWRREVLTRVQIADESTR